MVKSAIKLERETRVKLNKIKYEIGASNIDETINRMIDICKKIKTFEKKEAKKNESKNKPININSKRSI